MKQTWEPTTSSSTSHWFTCCSLSNSLSPSILLPHLQLLPRSYSHQQPKTATDSSRCSLTSIFLSFTFFISSASHLHHPSFLLFHLLSPLFHSLNYPQFKYWLSWERKKTMHLLSHCNIFQVSKERSATLLTPPLPLSFLPPSVQTCKFQERERETIYRYLIQGSKKVFLKKTLMNLLPTQWIEGFY